MNPSSERRFAWEMRDLGEKGATMKANINLKALGSLWIAVISLSLTACPGAQNGISGQVTAPTGQVLSNVSVGACFGGNCSASNSKEVLVNGGNSTNYQIGGLAPGQYAVIAIKDVNNSGRLDVGDWIGSFGPLNNLTPVTPPANNINVQMGVVTSVQGTTEQLGVRLEALESLIKHDTP
jgi:hypothetical protein